MEEIGDPVEGLETVASNDMTSSHNKSKVTAEVELQPELAANIEKNREVSEEMEIEDKFVSEIM